jgi:hypothetical protein
VEGCGKSGPHQNSIPTPSSPYVLSVKFVVISSIIDDSGVLGHDDVSLGK